MIARDTVSISQAARERAEQEERWRSMSAHQQNVMDRKWEIDTARFAVRVFIVVFAGMALFAALAKYGT